MKVKRLFAVVMVAVLMMPITAKAAPPPVIVDNFDAKRYADAYADLKETFGYDEAALWQHYQMFGLQEGRQIFIKNVGPGLTQSNFDAKRYADAYADLKEAFGYDEAQLWLHYLMFGINEGRQISAKHIEPEQPARTGVEITTDESSPEEVKEVVGPEPPLPPVVGPEPPVKGIVGPEPPLPSEECWMIPAIEYHAYVYPSSPGPWSRDDYDPNQRYIAVPSSDDQWGRMYPEFLTPEEYSERFGNPPSNS